MDGYLKQNRNDPRIINNALHHSTAGKSLLKVQVKVLPEQTERGRIANLKLIGLV